MKLAVWIIAAALVTIAATPFLAGMSSQTECNAACAYLVSESL